MSISKKPIKSSSKQLAGQRERFVEAAREAGCSEDEAEIRETMKRIAAVKVPAPAQPKK